MIGMIPAPGGICFSKTGRSAGGFRSFSGREANLVWRRRRHDDEVPVTQAKPCGNGVETSGDTSAAGVTSPLFLPNCLYPVATYHGTTDEVFPVHTGRTPKPSA